MSSRSSSNKTWRIPRTGLIAAIVTFLILGSSGVAYAYWSANATATSTAKAGSIAVTLAGVSSIQNTFTNNVRTQTGSFTVANTSTTSSTAALPVSIALSIVSGGSSVLATNLGVTVWGPVAAANCTSAATPSGTVATGTWASFTAFSSTLSAGQSASWCVRTSNVERSTIAAAAGTLSIQPKVTATLTAGTWTSTATATSTHNTQYIFPAAIPTSSTWFNIVTSSGVCLEVSASGGAGSALVRSTCGAIANKAFQLNGADGNGYLNLTPKHNVNLRWENGGSAVTVQNSSGSGNQAWQLQSVSSGVYQIVNKISGLCVTSSALSPSSTTLAVCSGSADQKFTLAPVTFTMNLVCENKDNNGSKGWVRYTWSAGTAGMYTFQADFDTSAGVNWQTIGSSNADQVSANIDGTLPSTNPINTWASTTYDVRVVDGSGGVVATSAIRVRPSGGFECG